MWRGRCMDRASREETPSRAMNLVCAGSSVVRTLVDRWLRDTGRRRVRPRRRSPPRPALAEADDDPLIAPVGVSWLRLGVRACGEGRWPTCSCSPTRVRTTSRQERIARCDRAGEPLEDAQPISGFTPGVAAAAPGPAAWRRSRFVGGLEDQVRQSCCLSKRVVSRVGPVDQRNGGAGIKSLSLLLLQPCVLGPAEHHPSCDTRLAEAPDKRRLAAQILAVGADCGAERSPVVPLQIRHPRLSMLRRNRTLHSPGNHFGHRPLCEHPESRYAADAVKAPQESGLVLSREGWREQHHRP